LFCRFFGGSARQAHAYTNDRWASLAIHAGLPQLLAFSIGFTKIPVLEIGVHGGYMPVTAIINAAMPLSNVPLTVNGTNYDLIPSPTYGFTNFGGYLRILPFKRPWYFEFDVSYFRMWGTVTGNCKTLPQEW
jgi:hypothetical protein